MNYEDRFVPPLIGEWIEPNTQEKVLFFSTYDNSVSLKIEDETSKIELMHNYYGAWGETLYIYEPVIKNCIDNQLSPVFLSIGLGLGYIEIMTVACTLKHAPHLLQSEGFSIFSFEIKDYLKKYFIDFFMEKYIPEVFHNAYDNIVEKIAAHYQLEKLILFKEIKELILKNKINFEDGFSVSTKIKFPASGIFFDAFSEKASPELWDQECLDFIVSPTICGAKSFFATYASKGILKRTLKNHGFAVLKKQGYLCKRESIFAQR